MKGNDPAIATVKPYVPMRVSSDIKLAGNELLGMIGEFHAVIMVHASASAGIHLIPLLALACEAKRSKRHNRIRRFHVSHVKDKRLNHIQSVGQGQ